MNKLFEAIDKLDAFTLNESLENDYQVGKEKFKQLWQSIDHSKARKEFYKAIGYGGKPKAVSSEEFEALSVGKDILTRTEDVAQHDKFLNGDYEHSTLVNSMYGTGIYFTLDDEGAAYYKQPGRITFQAILDNANITTTDEIKSLKNSLPNNEDIDSIIRADYGILAAILGYDAMYIKEQNYMLVMNRGKLIVADGVVNENALTESFREFDKQINDLEDQVYDLKDELVIYEPEEPEYAEINNQIDELNKQVNELKAKQQEAYKEEMKDLPPATNKTDFPGFDITQADSSSRTYFIPGNENREYALNKGNYIDSYIAEITPEQYLELCSRYGWGKEMEYSLDNIWSHLPDSDKKYVDEMAQAMKSGTIFKLPFIDIKDHSQEGRHRALAAMRANIHTLPCLIIF